MIKRLFILSCCFVSPCFAGIQNELTKFFDSQGFANNVTRGGAYQDQSGGYFTGGSLMTRSKVEDANLFSLQAPSFRAGCGGIDAHFGGFSYINGQAFVKLMNSIGRNAAGYAVSIALQTQAPQIKSAIDQLLSYVQDINNLNINSCQAGAALVGSIWPKSDASSKVLCQSIGMDNNKFSDYAAARQGCGAGGERDNINQQKQGEFADQLGDEFNLAWKALKKNALFQHDDALAELFMSVSGSVITKKQGNGDRIKIQPVYLNALVNDESLLKSMVEGGELEVYHCDNSGEDYCLNPTKHKIIIPREQSLLSKVDKMINSIALKMKTPNSSISDTERGFVNSTHIPILKIIAVQSAFKADNSPLSISDMSEMLAYDVLFSYLDKVVDIVAESVLHLQSVQISDNYIQQFSNDLMKAKQLIYQRRQGLFQHLNTTLAVIERTQQIEAQLHALFMQEVAK